MKVVESKCLDGTKYFFKIKDFVIHNEPFNIEVIAQLTPSNCSVHDIYQLNVENDLAVSKEDVESYILDKVKENINDYIHENPVF